MIYWIWGTATEVKNQVQRVSCIGKYVFCRFEVYLVNKGIQKRKKNFGVLESSMSTRSTCNMTALKLRRHLRLLHAKVFLVTDFLQPTRSGEETRSLHILSWECDWSLSWHTKTGAIDNELVLIYFSSSSSMYKFSFLLEAWWKILSFLMD